MGRPLSRDVLFSFGSLGYQLGGTLAAVSVQRPVEYVKNVLQNIETEQVPQNVLLPLTSLMLVNHKSLSPIPHIVCTVLYPVAVHILQPPVLRTSINVGGWHDLFLLLGAPVLL